MRIINKKILEAVHRGIQLALDDYQDIEPNSSISHDNDVIDSEDIIMYKIDLMKDVVDLGLPSGTLWCKYNLDVNPNQLSKAEDWNGGYYAWGELEPNKTNKKGEIYFVWDNYKFAKGSSTKLTKYCNNPKYGLKRFTDNLTELLPEDDAAYQNKKLHNYKFHIPTKEQCEELINYTSNYWVNNYDPNKTIHNQKDDEGIEGLNGRVFVGKNANQMFIPAAGFHDHSAIYDVGMACYSWSSHLNQPDGPYNLYFDIHYACMYDSNRCNGFTIRPVINS